MTNNFNFFSIFYELRSLVLLVDMISFVFFLTLGYVCFARQDWKKDIDHLAPGVAVRTVSHKKMQKFSQQKVDKCRLEDCSSSNMVSFTSFITRCNTCNQYSLFKYSQSV